jgi:hypothetical protein
MVNVGVWVAACHLGSESERAETAVCTSLGVTKGRIPKEVNQRDGGSRVGRVTDRPSGHSMTTTTSPAPTVSPAATLISLTLPDFSALIWFSIFIASSTTTA